MPSPPSKRAVGRPSKASIQEQQVETILDRVSAGETLEQVCKTPGMPTPSQFRFWVRKDKALGVEWHQARHDYAHALFDKMADLAAQLASGKFGRDDTAKVTAIRTAIEAFKHITARLAPEVYAEQKAGTQGVIVNIVTSLPLGQGSQAEKPIDTSFRVVGRVKDAG